MSIRIKVCGMTKFDQVLQLADLGIDYLGFIFYDKSPRFAANSFNDDEIEQISALHLSRVGVFVNDSIEHLASTVNKWKLDYVQLHGDESPEYCQAVSSFCKVIKAFRIDHAEDVTALSNAYKDISYFLFDTKSQLYGGSGIKFNWEQLLVPLHAKYFLSGGISKDDVNSLLEFSKKANSMYAIDINSKFESAPGDKDIDLITNFVQQFKNMENE